MDSSVLAVARKSTRDKSTGTSRYKSRKEWFCSASKTSSMAEAGSPRKSWLILSSSSNKNTGLSVPAWRRDDTTQPGIAPT